MQDTENETIAYMQHLYSEVYRAHNRAINEGMELSEQEIQQQRYEIHSIYTIGCCDKLSSNFSIECIDKY